MDRQPDNRAVSLIKLSDLRATTPLSFPGSAAAADAGRPSAPIHPDIHLFKSGQDQHLFVVNASQVYRLDKEDYARFQEATEPHSTKSVGEVLAALGLDSPTAINDVPIADPPIRALSLAVAQKCNLGCSYCYAQEGSFGGPSKQMSIATALSAVDRLFADAESGQSTNLSFLGGEPLFAREVIRAATEKAARLGAAHNIQTGFSITTNGTLINAEDGDFFDRYGFAVTISLDGIGATHDRQRPFKSGAGTFSKIVERVRPLLRRQHRMQVSARVTVTSENLELRRTLDELLELGFHSVGFSPMLSSPNGHSEITSEGLAIMLEQMVDCGRAFENKVIRGERYAFSNMVAALKEIHRGTHRPYPCGAGAGYLGVSADGELSACHRFVNDEAGFMGTLAAGVDDMRRNAWLADRHVHRQEPCRSCWARYLCGGGCHHEVIHRGRPACGYIRGWLHYCLQAYARILERQPGYLAGSQA
jgi:uncharacterized protein